MGRVYAMSDKAWRASGTIGAFETLNPTMTRYGKIIFDAPMDRSYSLVLSSDYQSKDRALITMRPDPERAATPQSTPGEQSSPAATSKAKKSTRTK